MEGEKRKGKGRQISETERDGREEERQMEREDR